MIAALEKKSLADLAKCRVDGSLALALAELAALPNADVVVEGRDKRHLQLDYVAPGFIVGLALQLRYAGVPIIFCETRPLAEAWTFRFLDAALSNAKDPRGSD